MNTAALVVRITRYNIEWHGVLQDMAPLTRLATEHIRGPFLKALVTQQIRSMPNSFLPPAPIHLPGMILLGDAMNMRHPLTGAGMSVALHDILIWRDLLRGVPDLRDHSAILSCSRKFQRQRKMYHSFVVNVLAQALYALFSASDGKRCSVYDVQTEGILSCLILQSTFVSCVEPVLATFSWEVWQSLDLSAFYQCE